MLDEALVEEVKTTKLTNYPDVLVHYKKVYPTENEYRKVLLKVWLYMTLAEYGSRENCNIPTFEEFLTNLKLFDAVNSVTSHALDLSDIGDGSLDYAKTLLITNHGGLA